MKVCKYCESECRDSVEICPSCGAKEFDNKCENCGKVFKSEYCPNCGIKAGTKAKICPKCGREYFTNACPDCGYVPTGEKETVYVYNNNPTPPLRTKRRTWLWVLGWIFIFPVPLTILLTRRENNLSTPLKIIFVVLAWIVYFALAYMGQQDETAQQAQSETVTVTQQQEIETTEIVVYE